MRQEKEILSDIMQLEECATESNLEALEYKRQQLLELRQKKMDGMIVIWLSEGEKKKPKKLL